VGPRASLWSREAFLITAGDRTRAVQSSACHYNDGTCLASYLTVNNNRHKGRNVTSTSVALPASHTALPMVTLTNSPCTNVTLTFHFDFGLEHPVHGRYGWGRPTPRRRSNCQTKKLKSGYGPYWGPGTRRTGRQTVGRNVTWNWTCVIALQITDTSSRKRGRPTWKINKL
jgi:hypothetical protein